MKKHFSKSHAVFHSKIYHFPTLLSILLETRKKYDEPIEGTMYSLSHIKQNFSKMLESFPRELDLNEAKFWQIDDFNVPEDLLSEALCDLVSDALCHIENMNQAETYCLPIISDIQTLFPGIFPDEKLSHTLSQDLISSTFRYFALCNTGATDAIMEANIAKAAIRCAKTYNDRYNHLSKPLAIELIRTYAGIKGTEFKKRQQ